jgi:hypothetical protein
MSASDTEPVRALARLVHEAEATPVMAWLASAVMVLSGVVAGECCCLVLLPQLSPVVIGQVDEVDATVLIAVHPRARGARCR